MIQSVWLGAAAAALAVTGSDMQDLDRQRGIAPARDGNVAIEEEFCSARKAGTLAALDLFIARHPGHPLIEPAKKERAKLAAGGGIRR